MVSPYKSGALQVWAAYSPVKNSPADARAKVAGGTPSHSSSSSLLYANQQTSDGDSRAVTELSSQSVCSSPPSPMTRTVTTTTSS